jgi:hypothetical protein
MNAFDGAKCTDLRTILKDIDTDLDISFDYESEKYTIYHKQAYFMNIPFGEFDRKKVEEIRKVVWLNVNGNVLDDIDKNNEKVEQSHDRDLSNLAECMAKDLRKPLLDAIDYGR